MPKPCRIVRAAVLAAASLSATAAGQSPDDLQILRIDIFADGFETGDTSRWGA